MTPPWPARLLRAGRRSHGRTMGSCPPAWRRSRGRSRRPGRSPRLGSLALRPGRRRPAPRPSSWP
eukprot:11392173-Alexandrium_andersonii.AAC.1